VLSYGANISIDTLTKTLWNTTFVASGRELANVLWSNTSATVSDIANSLKSQLSFTASNIADVLSYGANISIDTITKTLWNTTFVADSRQLADILWSNTSATANNIAKSLKSQLNFSVNTIADALDFGANLSINQITDALFDSDFVANSNELAQILWRSTRATTNQISSAFQQILNISVSVSQIKNIVSGVTQAVGSFFQGIFS